MTKLAVPINQYAAAELPPHPLTEEQKAARRGNAEGCACPFLKTAYVQGQLEADEAGYAPLEKVYNVMDWAGIGRMAFPQAGYFEKFGVSGVPILHLSRNRPNDSGILHPYIGDDERKERLEDFLGYANDNGEFTLVELEDAAEAWCTDIGGCDTLFGPRGEFATVITAFGRTDKKWKYLTKQDVTDLFYHNQWPEGFDQRRVPETGPVTMIDLTMFYRFMKMGGVEKEHVKKLGHDITVPPADQKEEFRPWPNPPVSDTPDGKVITQEEIEKTVKGGELCVFDSRWGGIQPVIDGHRFEFTPSMYQTTIEEVVGEEPSGPPFLLIIIVIAAAFFGWRYYKKSKSDESDETPIGEKTPILGRVLGTSKK